MYTKNIVLKKITKTSSTYIWACFVIFFFTSCSKDKDDTLIPIPENRYEFKVPSNFPKPTYTFHNNPITKEGFLLGKKLFNDPLLSRDGSVACSNCHIQSTTFADSPIHPISVGIENRLGIRNAPPLTNLAFMPEFFWDGGVTHLDFVPLNAIESEFEMDNDIEKVITRLNKNEDYITEFKNAFGIESITSPYLFYALSQFTNRMISANSKYDKYIRKEGTTLTAIELQGLELFKQKCSSCHAGELFTDFSYRNNGLDSTFKDKGRHIITSLKSDIGKFRVPSLRNVELTSPYMHNARFKTLEEVLDHYESGMVNSETIDDVFKQNSTLGVAMNANEKSAIIAFLKTLTDKSFTKDTLFFFKN